MTVATPSPRQKPSAVSSNVLQEPVLEQNCARLSPAKRSGVVMILRPPATAVSQASASLRVGQHFLKHIDAKGWIMSRLDIGKLSTIVITF